MMEIETVTKTPERVENADFGDLIHYLKMPGGEKLIASREGIRVKFEDGKFRSGSKDMFHGFYIPTQEDLCASDWLIERVK